MRGNSNSTWWVFCISDNAGDTITMLLFLSCTEISNCEQRYFAVIPICIYHYYLLGQSRVDKDLLQPIGHFKFIERREKVLKTKKKKDYKNLIIFKYLKDLLHISLKIPPQGMPRKGGKSIHTKYFFLWILIPYDLKTSDHEKSYLP